MTDVSTPVKDLKASAFLRFDVTVYATNAALTGRQGLSFNPVKLKKLVWSASSRSFTRYINIRVFGFLLTKTTRRKVYLPTASF